ncbi:MAG: hypothetical protein LAN37_14365 [Acidobacteriia bacterium]|nr:hypothetical protein [Terriglobia bacterium]
MKRAFQSVALALLMALLAAPAAAMVMCAGMSAAEHCPSMPAERCADCPESGATASMEQQPMPMDGSCCALSPARPVPRTDLQGPAVSHASVAPMKTLALAAPALPTPPSEVRDAVFLTPAHSPQAVLCTFLI